jgi:hypothetical protein
MIDGRASAYDQTTGSLVLETEKKELILSTYQDLTVHHELPAWDGSRKTVSLTRTDGREMELEIVDDDLGTSSGSLISDNGVIGIGKRSKFVAIFPNFLLTRDGQNLRLHIGQPNPIHVCLDQVPMTYIKTRTSDTWIVTMEPSVLMNGAYPRPQQSYIPDLTAGDSAIIATGLDFEVLPYEAVLVPIIEAVQSSGAGVYVRDSGLIGSNLEFTNCQTLDSFPKILYAFYTQEGSGYQHKLDIVLEPSDYALVIPGVSTGSSRCVTFIRSRGWHSSFFSSRIGANLFRNVAVHFDASNETIGFCDPI